MNTSQVLQVLKKDTFTSKYDCHVLPLNHFLNKYFSRPSLIVFNYDNCDQPGSHWVAVFVDETSVEYFDSYAFPPVNELITNKLISLGNTKSVAFNFSCFQGISSVCGQYCLVYLLLRSRGYKMDQIEKILLQCGSTSERDQVVNTFINQGFGDLFSSYLKVHNSILEK